MGYSSYTLDAGAQDLIGAAFFNVGNEPLNIQSITIPEDKISDGRDYIKIYTPGSSYQTYYYYEVTVDDPDAEEPEELGPGWGDGNGARVDDIILKLGQGCWIKTIKTAQVKLHSPLTVTEDAE